MPEFGDIDISTLKIQRSETSIATQTQFTIERCGATFGLSGSCDRGLILHITHFGGQITFLALPLTGALLLDATPLEMGVMTALEALPFALFGLFAGVLVDRAPKLRSSYGRTSRAPWPCSRCRFARARRALHGGALCGRVPGRTWNRLRLAGLPGLMTERVGRSNLVEANAKIGVSDSAAQLIGPGIAVR